MKTQILNYTFNKTNKTVTFTDYTSIRLDGVLLITNVESNTIIYNFACTGLGGSVLTNVLTLDYDTSSMTDTDKLQIFYDDPSKNASTSEKQDSQITLQTTLNTLASTLQTLTQRLEVLASMANSGPPAIRTIPIASVSTAVTGSVTATVASTVVSSLTNFGTGIPATEMAHDINNSTAILANINNVTITT